MPYSRVVLNVYADALVHALDADGAGAKVAGGAVALGDFVEGVVGGWGCGGVGQVAAFGDGVVAALGGGEVGDGAVGTAGLGVAGGGVG